MNDVTGDVPIGQITREDCDSHLRNRGYRDGKVIRNLRIIHGVLKKFFSWAVSRGILTDSPLPELEVKDAQALPAYIFSHDELKALFQTASSMQIPRWSVTPSVMTAALKLTFTMGLRPSEILGVKLKDVQLVPPIEHLVVRDTKFGKTRIVPFREEIGDIIEGLLSGYQEDGLPYDDERSLISNKKGGQVSIDIFELFFAAARDAAGISRDGERTPRLTDLRHTFATMRVEQGYLRGEDMVALLPALSTYMGHVSPHSTQVYIQMTKGILSKASEMFFNYVNGSNNEI